MPLYPATSSIAGASKTLLSLKSGWFYVQILVFLSSLDLDNLKVRENIVFKSENLVSTGIFKMYLTEKQAQYLQNNKIAILKPVIRPKQLQSASDDELFVRAIPNWEPPSGARITSRMTESIYTVRGATISQLLQDDRVLHAEVLPMAQVANRYANGYIQSGDEKLGYYDGMLETNRVANRKGLSGEGQVITILDTGLDSYHSFFYDRKVELPINKTNLAHRKIVRYDAFMDDFDNINGHGTHVAGIAAGSPYSQRDGLKMYSGIAPEAKIYFVDTATSNQTDSNITAAVEWTKIIPNMRSLNSYITSNSWGYSMPFPSFTLTYDILAYENPDILFLFAAGNDYRYMTINSPGDSKNIFTVGATNPPKSRYLDSLVTNDLPRRQFISNGTYNIQINNFVKDIDIWNVTITNPNNIPHDAEMIDYVAGANVRKKIVRHEFPRRANPNWALIKELYDNGAYAVITKVGTPPGRTPDEFKDIKQRFIVAWTSNADFVEIKKWNKASIAFERVGNEEMGPAPFTSKGPTWVSIMKPDVSAPGALTISAAAGDPFEKKARPVSFDTLISLSGTSMSTPAIAGAAALVRQFFVEKYYPTFKNGTGRKIDPSATLLKAMLICAANGQTVPSNSLGFGVPFLSNIFGYNGLKLRVINVQAIESNSHHVYKITIMNNKDFSVVMSYVDPPVHSLESGYTLFADLDLYIETPDGKIVIANMPKGSEYTDSFATNEKVLIPKAEVVNGEYKIHVTSSVYPMEQDVKYSLVVAGDFSDSVTDPLPMEQGTTCPDNCNGHGKCVKGKCQCNNGYASFSCKQKSTEILDTSITYVTKALPIKEITYYQMSYHNPITPTIPLELVFVGNKIQPVACFSTEMGSIANSNWTCMSYDSQKIRYRPTKEIKSNERIHIAVFQPGRESGLIEGDFSKIKFKVYIDTKPDAGPAPPAPPPRPAPLPPLPPLDPVDPAPGPDPNPNPNPGPFDPMPRPHDPDVTKAPVPVPPLDQVPESDENKDNASQKDKNSNKKAAIVVGGIVGGIACAAGVGIGVIYLIKRNRFTSARVEYHLSDE